MPRRHAIITACDARFGDFLINHWLSSLRANVNLEDVDVVVLDYGLTDNQRSTLSHVGVRCFPCVKDGVVCNLRYRDMCRLFDECDYDQVLSIDSGDVIFQADIRPLFDVHTNAFRAVPEELQIPFNELLIQRTDLQPSQFDRILEFLHDKPLVNAGAVFGPASAFRSFWQEYLKVCDSFHCFGVDQLVLNYVLYRDGFVTLDPGYNFVLISNKSGFSIKNGVFFDSRGKVIPVVHNAGNQEATRIIYNFGYGPDRNRRRLLLPIGVRLLVWFGSLWKLLSRLRRSRGPAPA